MTIPIRIPSTTTVAALTQPVTADVTAIPLEPSAELQAIINRGLALQQPTIMDQLSGTLGQIVRDPPGAVVGIAKGIGNDVVTIFGVTNEELDQPEIQARIKAMGLEPELLRPIAAFTDKLLDTLGSQDKEGRLAAGQRLTALVAGGAAAGVARGIIGPVTTLSSTLGRGVAEAVAFGTVGGTLTPLEEGQTKAGNIITWSTIGIPLATLGGVTSFAAQRFLAARGIKPALEAPEVTPTTPDFEPIAAVRNNAPFVSDLRGTTTMGARIALREQRPAPRGRPVRPIEGARPVERIPPERMTPPEGAPEVLGGTAEQLAAREATRISEGAAQLREAGAMARRAEPRFWDRIHNERGSMGIPDVPLSDAESQVMSRISVGGKTKKAPATWNQFYTHYLDDLHPINVATEQLMRLAGESGRLIPGKRLPGIEDPYVLARITRGSIGKANAMLEEGVTAWDSLQPITQGLKEILREVGETGMLDHLRSYLVSRHGIDLATTQGLKIPFDIEAAKSVVENVSPIVGRAAAGIDRFQAALRKYVMDSGLWSAEQVKLMETLNPSYVPFFRFIEEARPFDDIPAGPQVSGRRFANLPKGTRKAKGGKQLPLIDPLENIVRNTYSLVQLADRHAVSNQLVRLAEEAPGQDIVVPARPKVRPMDISGEVGRAFRNMGIELTEEQLLDLSQTFRPTQSLGEGIISVWREGQRKYFKVDPELYSALLDLGKESSHQVVRMLLAPAARLLRAGATLSPRFITRNPIRDQFTAAVFSKFGFKPGFDLYKGLFHVMERDRLYNDFRRSGGEQASLVRTTAAERRGLQRTLDEVISRESVLADAWRTVKGPKGWLEGLRQLSSAMEQATRVREFERALSKTGDPRLAAFASREVTIDFARMGTNIRVLNQIIPFFNANVQGIDKLIRAFKDNPVRASALAAGYITLPTLALYAINHDDPVYNQLTEVRRDMFWNFPLYQWNAEAGRLERTGNFFSIPKPFDAGLIFGAGAERVARWVKEKDPEAWDKFATTLLDSFMPGLLPTAIAPPVEVISNYSFFRNRPIIPEREQDLIKPEQAGPMQGETVRLLGKALGVSPRNIEHIVRGYTGGLGEGTLAAVDLLLDKINLSEGPIEPRTPLERTPLIGPMAGQFLVREPTISSKNVEMFYRNWESVSAIYMTVQSFIAQKRWVEANQLTLASRAELTAYDSMRKAAEELSKTMKLIREVRANKMLNREDRESRLRFLGRNYRTIAGNANIEYNNAKKNLDGDQNREPVLSAPGETWTPLVDIH